MLDYSKLPADQKEKVKRQDNSTNTQAILESVVEYNHRSQLDMAMHIFDLFLRAKDRRLQINAVNKIFTLWFELSDQYYLVFKLLETKNWQNFIRSSNAQAEKFYQAAAEGVDPDRFRKIMGIESSPHVRRRVHKALDAYAGNLQKMGKIFVNTASAISGSTAIKHGYKVVYPTNTANEVFYFDGGDYLVMDRIDRAINMPGMKSEKDYIATGRLGRDPKDEQETLRKILKNMEIYAESICELADMGLRKATDKYFYLSKSLRIVKVGPNEECPCRTRISFDGSKYEKYKRCHGLI